MKAQSKNIFTLVSYSILGVAVIASTALASSAWRKVKLRPKRRTIRVTGSAKKRIQSDKIVWSATLDAKDMDRTVAFKKLKSNVQKVLDYLAKKGVKKDEISVGSVSFSERSATEYHGTGAERVEKTVFKGYVTQQTISVTSTDVKRVERISREVTSLLEQGITVHSSDPKYYYTKIGELKIVMLAEASADARDRAENIVSKADRTKLGRLKWAKMGVININPANSTSVSWDGNNDTSSLEKDIITIVHAEYYLD